jgi:ATP-dependent exoDNAse (exonuclease V) beta subunit
MPACSKQINPKGIEITFEEETHKYSSIIDGKEILYTSGTTFVHNFFPKFDPTGEITKRCALREGLTVEAIKAKWKEKANKSAKFGTKIHETMEDVLRGDMLRNKPNDDKEKNTMSSAIKLAKKILSRAEIIGIEKIVFDSDIKIAGTIDLLIRAKKDGKIWILDHKTNERIDTFNKWNSFALKPIENIPNTNYFQYTLQLNLYENILKRVGYVDDGEIIDKALFHITESGNKTYPVTSAQKEIELMIQHHLSGV